MPTPSHASPPTSDDWLRLHRELVPELFRCVSRRVGADRTLAEDLVQETWLRALETWRKGAAVTMVVRKTEIGSRVKYWARPDIVNRIEEGSIKAYFESELVSITPKTATIQTSEGSLTIENDFVVIATGYQPNFAFLEKIGVQLSDDEKRYPKYNPETQESNLPGLYLAGVICGGMDTHVWFIENSRVHAERIVADIVGKAGI